MTLLGVAQDDASSWVSTGASIGISADQVEQVLGGSSLGDVASRLGMPRGQASSVIAQLLPELVNQLTPNGQLPDDQEDSISSALAMVRGGAACNKP